GNAGATHFTIKPGNLEVLEGDPIEIEINYTGSEGQLELWMEMQDGAEFSQSLVRAGERFRYVLDPARQSFRYRVRAGRAESDTYSATVWPLPEILNPRVTLKFPDYTALPAEEIALGRGIEAVTGTAVTLSGTINTAVEEAWLEIGAKRVAE